MPGHEPCCGCGSDAISCERLSELTKVTLWPREIVTDDELTPDPVSVIVAPIGPVLPVLLEITVTDEGPVVTPAAATGNCDEETTHADASADETNRDGRERRWGTDAGGNQKNLREMLKPMNQEVLSTEPRAICPSVVPIPFEKFTWKKCPPARPSRPKLIRPTPGA